MGAEEAPLLHRITGLWLNNLMTAKRGRFRYPHQVYEKGPPTTFPQVKGHLTHSVAGEGFEPSKLSRWIYSPWATTL
jgi:hypothetical protein